MRENYAAKQKPSIFSNVFNQCDKIFTFVIHKHVIQIFTIKIWIYKNKMFLTMYWYEYRRQYVTCSFISPKKWVQIYFTVVINDVFKISV